MRRAVAAALAALVLPLLVVAGTTQPAAGWENTDTCASPAERDALDVGAYPSGNGGSTLSKVRKTFGSEENPYTGRLEWIEEIDTEAGPGGMVWMSSRSWAWCPNRNVRLHGYFNAEGTDPDKLNGPWLLLQEKK